MEWTGLNELREKYLTFFEQKGHLRLGSFPLVPKNDPSLLLINSGMAPMKKWFLGQEEPPRHRVTTCQKCIRTPDIENVGITARHGTFFEMLGNFSFQDYFKEDVIPWAWEFLTSDQWMGIPSEKLYISVYEEDDEAYNIWTKKMNISPEHMVRFGKADNFWEHGSGPCGPCSEIYFDRGPEHGCGKPDCHVGCDCDRFMEIWNLVFSQFDSDGKGHYERLAKPNIDTGMGLERLACVMQGVGNLFEVDTVQSVLHHVERISGKKYGEEEHNDISIRVITDHIRSTVFMVSDGVLPSNEGRGYVLRRLLRRAARHGRMLGINRPFLVELVDTVIKSSEVGYPELREHEEYIKKIVGTEESRFYKTIDAGMTILNNLIDGMERSKTRVLSGLEAFKLNDTFGFPLDLVKEIAAERGFSVDEKTFRSEMEKQKRRAREERLAKNISGWEADLFADLSTEATRFTGYTTLKDIGKVVALSDGNELTEAVATDDGAKGSVLVILDKTPFYAEMGGQVADRGIISTADATLQVLDVNKTPKGYFVHNCILENGTIKVGDTAKLSVDKDRRMNISRNHTATHLLQSALREVLGKHVHQAGSYQDAEITRFDFTHFSAMTSEEIEAVEHIVNQKIFEAMEVSVREMPIEEAKKLGAMALFGEKYGDVVRVVDVQGWSTEFCGGTHVRNTAQLGCFKILSEGSVAAGVRRIEATAGYGVLRLLDERTNMLIQIAGAVKANSFKDVSARAIAMAEENKKLGHELQSMKEKMAGSRIDGLFESALELNGIKMIVASFSGTGVEALRTMCDKIRETAPNAVAVLVGANGEKVSVAVAVGSDALKCGLKAGILVKEIAAIAGGNGGGKPDFAMGSMKDDTKIDEALKAAPEIVKAHMS